MWNPPLIDSGDRGAALGAVGGGGPARRAGLPGRADDLLPQKPARDRADPALRPRQPRCARGKPELAERIAPYRGGYTPQQRREIEARLSAGELLAVIATDALELGIDVGELDAAICVTFPGTVASLRQMWGRAGRRRRGLAVYVAGHDALDQFFCRHPDEFLERPVEAAILDHRQRADRRAAPARGGLRAAAERGRRGVLRARAGGSGQSGWWRRGSCAGPAGGCCRAAASSSPRRSPLRSASADSVAVIERDSGEMLGLVEAERAFTTIHPGAVYLHLGRSYEVERLDIEGRRAIVSRFDGDWYTRPKKETEIYIERIREQRAGGRGGAALRRGLRHRAGDRLPAGLDLRAGADRHRRPGAARAELRHPGALVRAAGARSARRCRPTPCSAPCTRPSTARSRCCR